MSELRFDGKVAVVTGAGNGLGKAYALLLGARGAKVVVNDLGGSTTGEGSDTRAADLVVEEIKKAGGEACSNYDSVEFGDKIIKTAVDTYGRIDILINNAGILRDVALHKMTQKDYDLIMTVHMLGTYKTTRAAYDHMRAQKYGRIINVASAAGLYGNFGQTNYAAAKLGILGFTQAVALEGASKNILANCIAPLAGSRMTETVMPKEMVDALRPEFVAPVVAYLAHESCETSGKVFELGAGWVAQLRWQRSKGGVLPAGQASPEGVASIWDKVTDFDNEPEYPESTNDSLSPVMEALETSKL
mmetsp:Transcript_23149/g.40987  ORF Transcript_23149/g.40987 Transcript_23149/m.40987 type:complete len:303 (-) Transcript_23149:206-1114(-)|eukprot:CAMPEP_0184522994 /NCGR_PEP_ID=MMETSP0198_2-20121128/8621_1 /TAXON_ID=1112570 /ORGANISM="Thraustochytrium sp., Strain LLF1b" /LENGTH=302 /DNA_ID=CAMNT_0026913943 /DNA_START=206 /DNA_END=1114 /DNA_ORIENTATION=+